MAEKKSLKQLAEVVREGRKIILPADPEPMAARTAALLLKNLAEQEEETISLLAEFKATPWAGLVALYTALERLHGFVLNKPKETFFGPVPPAAVTVQVGPDSYRDVIWGVFTIPGTTISLEPSVGQANGIATFKLQGQAQRKDREIAQQLFAEIRQEVQENSIYQGRAITLKQDDDNPAELDLAGADSIRFLRTDPTLRGSLVLNQHTLDAVEVELMTPVEHRDYAKEVWGISMNRVVLLSGTYGTGKSMTGAALAHVVTENGGTYILLRNVAALPRAIDFVKVFGLRNVVIFAEDIDRVMSGARDSDKDTLLNLISGAESAVTEIMIVLTTNDIEKIHPAMIRRFQAVVDYGLPDEDCARRLVLHYGAGRVQGDLKESPKLLAGQLPALIKDCVNSAKLAAVRARREFVEDEDLVFAAQQLDVRARLSQREVKPEPLAVALQQLGKALSNGQGEAIEMIPDIKSAVEAINRRI